MRLAFHRALWPAAMVVAGGCGDLAWNADQEPAYLELAPEDTLVAPGDSIHLELRVFDREDNPLPGPPDWAAVRWEWTDTNAVEVAQDGRLLTHKGGDVWVTAHLAGLRDWTRLKINPSRIVLRAPLIYLNQVIQDREGSVPLIAGRPALLRIFATGHEVSFYRPTVRAVLYRDGEIVLTGEIPLESEVLPDQPDESRIDRSFNMEIPGELIQPGLELVVELDTENTVPKVLGSKTRYPPGGAMPLDIVEMPVFQQTFLPTTDYYNRHDTRVFEWLKGIGPESHHVQVARTLLPIGEMEVFVHDTVYTTQDLTTKDGWRDYLRQIEVIWKMEGEKGYYYGVVVPPRGTAWSGLGYYTKPVSVGSNSPRIYAHEVGHNMSLRHAPCGKVGRSDPEFPFLDGSIGTWGYDFRHGRVMSPEFRKDVMGYCVPAWISAYHFKKAMNYRLSTSQTPAEPAEPQQTLMLWGSASRGEVLLEPAFLVETVPDMPTGGGVWRLTGFGPGGERVFDFGFSPDETEHGGANFRFNIPWDPERDGAIESVVLSGPDGEVTLSRSSTPPMAIIRDRATGQVRAILDNWAGDLTRVGGDVEVMVSEGLPGGRN